MIRRPPTLSFPPQPTSIVVFLSYSDLRRVNLCFLLPFLSFRRWRDGVFANTSANSIQSRRRTPFFPTNRRRPNQPPHCITELPKISLVISMVIQIGEENSYPNAPDKFISSS
ncbi:hypothetical protein TWF102_002435 [Orbilia oligospora]|uniref:Uncharacterized protein n=1 Tax=Orbilia oligospora TaxID=2813651 RepID=A0A7C8IZY9_ORBOL|nr:hypothetical protein TWF102_002435 [Orbilia oligospora]